MTNIAWNEKWRAGERRRRGLWKGLFLLLLLPPKRKLFRRKAGNERGKGALESGRRRRRRGESPSTTTIYEYNWRKKGEGKDRSNKSEEGGGGNGDVTQILGWAKKEKEDEALYSIWDGLKHTRPADPWCRLSSGRPFPLICHLWQLTCFTKSLKGDIVNIFLT